MIQNFKERNNRARTLISKALLDGIILVIEMRCQINRQTFRGIPGFYSTSGYTAVIFSAHLVAVKCEVFTTTSTREIQLYARPATQLTRSPYFRQIAYASRTSCAKIEVKGLYYLSSKFRRSEATVSRVIEANLIIGLLPILSHRVTQRPIKSIKNNRKIRHLWSS